MHLAVVLLPGQGQVAVPKRLSMLADHVRLLVVVAVELTGTTDGALKPLGMRTCAEPMLVDDLLVTRTTKSVTDWLFTDVGLIVACAAGEWSA